MGGIGIRSLAVIFRRMDENGNKRLDFDEFTAALGECGLFTSIPNAQALMKYFDVDGDGNISYEEFMRGLREPLTERRKNMVERAFEIMDRNGCGEITVQDICEIFSVEENADF